MRFIKCLSVLPFAVGDREGCSTTPVEAVFVFSASVKPSELSSSASSFCFSCLAASGVWRAGLPARS